MEDDADAADVDRATEDAAAQTARAIAAIALRPEQFFGKVFKTKSLHVSSEVTVRCQSYRSRIGRAAVALEPHSLPAPPHVVVHSERR